ncbi:MAG: sterol desaturase family protein [Myxococcales bacterium]|nr:sterol desaturase family protein [Myxococcales bacterium]
MSTATFMTLALLSSGVLMTALMVIYHSKISKGARIHERKNPLLTGKRFYKMAAYNTVLSIAMLYVGILGMGERYISPDPSPWWVAMLQVGLVLGLYDFFYYFAHRYLYHEWTILRKVHAVHHSGKYPTAVDSLYIHPIETFIGVFLLLVSLWIVGPIDVSAFHWVFIAYTHMNIINHCALDFHVFPLNVFGFLARKHDRHHDSMKVGNYATISPLPDLIFGTLD